MKNFKEYQMEFNNNRKNPNLEMVDERYIHTNNAKRREFLIVNRETGCSFWVQTHRLYSQNYSSIRYTRSNIKEYITKITNGEYSLISECNDFKSVVTIKHNTCGEDHTYRISHFINDNHRCPSCLRKSLMKSSNEYKQHLAEISNGSIILLDEYNGNRNKVKYKCLNCEKEFLNSPNNLDRQFLDYGEIRCPHCQCDIPIGEGYIIQYLTEKNILFKFQYSFPDCKYKKLLIFDFVVLNNTGDIIACIEFDGKQHYDENSCYYSPDIKIRDEIKDTYCKENNIPLLRTRITSKKLLFNDLDKFFNNLEAFNDYPNGGEIPQQE